MLSTDGRTHEGAPEVFHEIGGYFQLASTKLKSKNFDAGGTGWLRSPH